MAKKKEQTPKVAEEAKKVKKDQSPQMYEVVGTFCLTGKGSNTYDEGAIVQEDFLNNVPELVKQGFLKKV